MKKIVLVISTIYLLFAVGCSTLQLQSTAQTLHSINTGTVLDYNDMNDPNVAAVNQIISEAITAYDRSTLSGKTTDIMDAVAPYAVTYGGWAGLLGYAAYVIYNSRKKK